MEVLIELGYISVLCATLICWDLMDFYIEIKELNFLWTRSFWIHYTIRAFFSIVLMKIIFISNLLNISNNFIIAFITPLLFPLILQNLIVGIGGNEINTKDVFLGFRGTIIEGVVSHNIIKRVKIQTELLNSSLTNDDLKLQCRFLASSSTKFDILENSLNQKDEDYVRVEYIKVLTKWGGVNHAKGLIKDNKNSLKCRRNENE